MMEIKVAPNESYKLGWIKDNAIKSNVFLSLSCFSFLPAESSFFENLRMSSLPLSSVITLSLSAESWAFHIGSGHSVAQSLQSCRRPPVCSDSVSVISSSEQPVWSAKDSPGHWSRSGTLQQPWRCINRLRWGSWVSLTALEWLSDELSAVRGPRRVSRINTHRCQDNCWG